MQTISKPKLSSHRPIITMILIVIMVMVGQFTAGIYLPSLPFMVNYFHTTNTVVQWTIAAYYLSYGASQFVYGPLSDLFGRRRIALFSLAFFIVGCLIAITAFNIYVLVFGCFVQGLGIGGAGMLARAVPRDLYEKKQLLTANAWINVVLVITPLIAPIFGGYFQSYFGWRFNFLFLLVAGIFVLQLSWRKLPETFTNFSNKNITFSDIFRNYKVLFSNRFFLVYLLCSVAAFSVVPAYEVASAFLFQNLLGLTPVEFGWTLIIPFIGCIIGSLSTSKIKTYCNLNQIIGIGLSVMLISSFCMFAIALNDYLSVLALVVPMLFLFLGVGIVLTSAVSCAMQPYPNIAGITGSTLGGLQNIGGGVLAAVIADLSESSQLPLASILFGVTILCSLVFFLHCFFPSNQSNVAQT